MAWAPSGDSIAFSFSPSLDTQQRLQLTTGLYLVDADGSHMRRLVELLPDSMPGAVAWSPDGRQLVYAKRGRPGELHDRICILASDGATEKCIKDLDAVFGLAWSPDGSSIAYVGLENGAAGLRVVDLSGMFTIDLAPQDDWPASGPVAWAPDGQRLVYAASSTSYSARLYVVNRDGKGRKLIDEGTHYESIAWSPDGQWLALESPSLVYTRDNTVVVRRVDF